VKTKYKSGEKERERRERENKRGRFKAIENHKSIAIS
jgi:hypothetical protein